MVLANQVPSLVIRLTTGVLALKRLRDVLGKYSAGLALLRCLWWRYRN